MTIPHSPSSSLPAETKAQIEDVLHKWEAGDPETCALIYELLHTPDPAMDELLRTIERSQIRP